MRKTLLALLALSSMTVANAQTTPAITLKAGIDGASRTLSVALNAPGTVDIDWGDGELVSTTIGEAFDGWNNTDIAGTVKGDGTVKIYANGLVYFDCVSKVDGTHVESLELGNATDLQQLFISGNGMASLDITKNTQLTKVDAGNNALTSIDLSQNPELTNLTLTSNLLTDIDISKCQKLTTLYLNNNKFSGHLDLSTNPTLKSVYCINNELTSVDLGENTAAKPYFSFNNNKLTSFDASKLTQLSNGSLFLMGNQLTSIMLPEGVTAKTVNISKNNFTLTALPQSGVKTLTYAPQNDYVIASTQEVNTPLDLSCQTSEALNTTFSVLKEDGTALAEGTDYTVADGKITFLNAQTDSVYVTMATTVFSKFTGSNIYKTTKTLVNGAPTAIATINTGKATLKKADVLLTVEGLDAADEVSVYSVSGKHVATFKGNATLPMGKGLYLIKVNGTSAKMSF